MNITFKPYKRRDGSLMLYINRDNGVSVGLSPERGWAPYGKGITAGQRNAMGAAKAAFEAGSQPFTGDLKKHAETGFSAPIECGPYTLVGTDVGEIGGMKVGEDGVYVIRDGRIARCGVALAEPADRPDEED